MGIWEQSPASHNIAAKHPDLQEEFKKSKEHLSEKDILASPYAIYEYKPNPLLTSEQELGELREIMKRRGKSLILDFVPNHMSVDTSYLTNKPHLFLQTEIANQNSFIFQGTRYAHGRDPYFDAWTDTIQWDFSNEETLSFHIDILLYIAQFADGVRCDMAMLPLEDVFASTHGKRALPYWGPLIKTIKSKYPNFKFYAEAYWNREYELQSLGFDATYDKTLYDRFVNGDAFAIKAHLTADQNYQNKSIRFLENHDEDRAMKVFQDQSLFYFSLLCFLPGIILYYQDQVNGFEKKLPVQLGNRDLEETKKPIRSFYDRIFSNMQNRKHPHREIPEYYLYTDGEILPYLLTCEPNRKELIILNLMQYPMSGRIFLTGENFPKAELKDLISGSSFPRPTSEKEGLYFYLEAKEAQWFIF
ncbi:putative alpha amylase [Leptospira ryugenii]|uniref:Putative alpha amylase n=2 Tax=Leptospira ryugenii TaxID=1917863 RepID=A0A2P2DYP2_9LEPT|nr:putative alpha amylase [Leptospira ryugenii]